MRRSFLAAQGAAEARVLALRVRRLPAAAREAAIAKAPDAGRRPPAVQSTPRLTPRVVAFTPYSPSCRLARVAKRPVEQIANVLGMESVTLASVTSAR